MAKFGTNASGAIWWPNLELIQVVPSDGQIDEDTNSILTDNANRVFQGNVATRVIQVIQVIQVMQVIQVIHSLQVDSIQRR